MFTVYSKKQCPFCTDAKVLLTDLGFGYKEINIEESPEALVEFKSRYSTVPQIFDGDNYVGGFTDLQDYLIEGDYV